MFERIFDRYSKGIYRVIDTCASLVYWSLRVTRYFFPLTIALVLLSFTIFSLTWIIYLGFYWYWIPPKFISFPINFDYQNRYLSQFLPDYFLNSDNAFISKFPNSTQGFSQLNYKDRAYGNFISSHELSRQLLYEQSEASAILNFNNITWRYKSAVNKSNSFSNQNLLNQTKYLENLDMPTENINNFNTGVLKYLVHLKNYWSSKIYNFVTFNWYQKKRYYKGIDEGINQIIHKHVDLRFKNRMNLEVLGNEIDIIVELFYFPSQYNINITPFQITLDLIQCLESHLNYSIGIDNNSTNSSKILASFKKTSAIEYLPNIVLKFKEYISIIPSLLGIQINSLGLGLESKISVKLVENFPLRRKHPFNFNSLETNIKLCGAKIKMKPALHISKSNLIFQTKLPFWKEIIRNHPILMGNVISFIITLFFISVLSFIIFLSGLYFLWKKYSANNYNDFHISSSFLPTGTVTYTNCTPTSSYQINGNGLIQTNNQDFSTKNIPLSNCEQLLIDYSMTNSSININGLLPLETKQISHPRNQYMGHSQSFNDRNSDENIKSEENEDTHEKSIHSPKSNLSEA
ncbi:uncharacterized protein cubi_02767 [Cryptosporidium ubiquitum]|uniref:Uncharacterized protein n=1 Tax=Cryptosporidium ubiquitum TaxID=857276 RepID=A0A1J4MM68_9CRYT|nr:uncharacterized protein cubi_02767 [Cryptosporidium ubiquitum]OII73965.1 hypothetical protein cubi_02767 [Cryptosporidium ubiquitum]